MEKEKFIPLQKRSKKEQRKHNLTRRGDWNGVIPVTRVVPDKKKEASRRPGRVREEEE